MNNITETKIELRGLKIFLPGSQETINFVSDIYVNGKKCGHAENGGTGGPTNYDAYPGMEKLLEQAEAYCKTLPPETGQLNKDDPSTAYSHDMDLEGFIDNLVQAQTEKKEDATLVKKIAKKQVNHLMFTKTPATERLVSWTEQKFKFPLAEIISHPKGKEKIAGYIKEMTDQGYLVLNTNIPADLIPKENKRTLTDADSLAMQQSESRNYRKGKLPEVKFLDADNKDHNKILSPLMKVKGDNSAFGIKKGDLMRTYANYFDNGETYFLGVMNNKHVELPTVFFEELTPEETESMRLDFSIPFPSYADLSDADLLKAYRQVSYDKPIRPMPKDLHQEVKKRHLVPTTKKTVHS